MSSSSTSPSTTGQCCKFEAHRLRPEKCRNCFGDASQHSSPQAAARQQDDNASELTKTGSTKQNAMPPPIATNNSNLNKNADCESTRALEATPAAAEAAAGAVVVPGASVAVDADKQCKGCRERQDQIDKLRQELEQWQRQCQLAELESQRAREELHSLEDEMEELHDNFKEEESEQFEQVKQELDAALKNCKILQIRLNKSERQYNQLEQVKSMLEKQLEDSNQQQQQQQRQDHDELNATGQSITTLGGGGGGSFRRQQQQQQLRQQNSNELELYEMSISSGNHVSVPTIEYDQLLRDLTDTSERERDLQEQIKYSQEEAQLKGERLQAIEAENEILLGRINKLTLANSSLRSSLLSSPSPSSSSLRQNNNVQPQQQQQSGGDKLRDSYEQNEQLKLALEMAAAECQRLKVKLDEAQQALEMKDKSLEDLASQLAATAAAAALSSDKRGESSNKESGSGAAELASPQSRLELECRQLRARLAHSERECRQLRSQIELRLSTTTTTNTTSASNKSQQQQQRDSGADGVVAGRRLVSSLATAPRSQSVDAVESLSETLSSLSSSPSSSCNSSAKCQETIRQLDKQCRSLLERNNQLEMKLQRFIKYSGEDLDQKSSMESDLFDKLKRQLESSESELAKAKSRLVELDIECGKAQRQYKRLLASLDTCGTTGGELQLLRRNRLAPDSKRDSMSRQELRQALRDLELDIDELLTIVKAKESLIKEIQEQKDLLASNGNTGSGSASDARQQQQQQLVDSETCEQQVKSLRRLLDQEQLLGNNLKLDVANLERDNMELASRSQLLERERVAMEEELDKLRQLNGEYQAELEESRREKQLAVNKSRELNETVERIRFELNQVRQQQEQEHQQALKAAATASNTNKSSLSKSNNSSVDGSGQSSTPQSTDLLRMARDLSELKVKNGFLMRQLELARDDTARQLDELRQSSEAQLKRAVELAQIELKERHLQETQQLRDDCSEFKQKLASLQRQLARQEEESALERDRARELERDWRRDKSQWQQVREQLEGQLSIEKRSSEFRLKEAEAAIRDKERSLINVQDRCVQLERDLKRAQNKYKLLEEDSESKLKQLARDLEIKAKELAELSSEKQVREERQYELLKRLQDEKATLKETVEALKRSYDEKLSEARQLKELLYSRQEQSYKERSQQFDRIDALTRRLNELAELEAEVKLLKQRLEIQERQLESSRRELVQVRDERSKLRSRCDELEKRELISKTSHISGNSSTAASSFFKPFGSPRSQLLGSARATSPPRRSAQQLIASGQVASSQLEPNDDQAAVAVAAATAASEQRQSMIEKLSGKINDQRNLINILRQQLSETQIELKQLKLLQASERSKWQARVALQTSRLNECEEKLAYETSLLNKSSILIDQLAKPQLELSWHKERHASLELIQQQQAQIELLAKDLKRTSQAHDLLRMHSKQLESHNNKLSKKLIEYQQQTSMFSLQDRELELSYDKLMQRTSKISQEAKPLLDIVTKIVESLDAPDQQQQQQQQQQLERSRETRLMSDSTDRPLRAGAVNLASWQKQHAYDSEDSNDELASSTRAGKQHAATGSSRLTRLLAGGGGAQSKVLSTDQVGANKLITDQQQQQLQQIKPKKALKRVRVKCSTLGITTGEKKQLKQHLKALGDALSAEPASQRQHHVIIRKSTTITTTKSATAQGAAGSVGGGGGGGGCNFDSISLQATPSSGTTAINRRASAEELVPATTPAAQLYRGEQHQHQPHSVHSTTTTTKTHPIGGATQGRSQSQSRATTDYETATDQSSQQSSQQTTISRVHWQLDSDLESESSWSAAPAAGPMRTDTYRRFPQAGPPIRGHSCGPLSGNGGGGGGGAGASLTDYESESSLASDYSVSTFSPLQQVGGQGRRPGAPSGAESDSGLACYGSAAGKHASPSRKKASSSGGGLKGRLTSTLRNISRSITANLGGSDTEESSAPNWTTRRKTDRQLDKEAKAAAAAAAHLKEIRV